VHKDLSGLYASGGGDGPEAVTAGLMEALNMDWRSNATKLVILIADAPPHGIGEYGDGERFLMLAFTHIDTLHSQASRMAPQMAMTPYRLREKWPVAA
jgi:hypothetical protein